jgi:hypothetical protein
VVYESTIAPTTQGIHATKAGAKQLLVVDRVNFSAPEKLK